VEDHVARYGKEHKQATRQRIVEASGRRFKRDGIDGAGISTLMADAGLTNGAFYAHFSSKEDLVATTVADQLRAQRERYAGLVRDFAGVEELVTDYLSPEHRDNPSEGCPSAALLDEIGRCAEPVRKAYTEGTLAIVDDLAGRLAPDDPASVRGTVLGVFAMMFGTLQVARALADRELADEVLERGVQNALTLLAPQR
jgi:TetR/AcrR family transcriptional repressor of nem operon